MQLELKSTSESHLLQQLIQRESSLNSSTQ
jgi:hypothetical protein